MTGHRGGTGRRTRGRGFLPFDVFMSSLIAFTKQLGFLEGSEYYLMFLGCSTEVVPGVVLEVLLGEVKV